MSAIFLQILFGLLLADFLSGVVHFLEDEYGRADMPIIGPVFAANDLHHSDPNAFLQNTFLRRNVVTAGLSIALGLVVFLFTGLSVWLVIAVFFGAIANEIHSWAHGRPSNKLIVTLQRTNILLPPAQHAAHHRKPQDKAYCSVSGFLNPTLDALGFWRLPSALFRIFRKSTL